MSDRRNGLAANTEFNLPDGKRITIQEEVGRGASCIVYDAYYTDNISAKHRVRIKECYPIYLDPVREESGALSFAENEKEKFEAAKERFKTAYQKNVEVKNTLGLVNSTSNANELYEWNGTLYSMAAYDEGNDYRKHEDTSLKEVCEHVKAIAVVLQKYHTKGYLHLDIKPENVFVIPETREHVLLFDFDSVTTIAELKENMCYRLAYSDGFSAPELIRGRISQIGPQTDIYSLGALLFYKVFGRKPMLKEGSLGTSFDYSVMKFRDDRYSPRLYRELTQMFQKTLATSTISRWKEVSFFIESLDRIIELSDLDRIYLRGNFAYNSRNFIGRNKELSRIGAELEKSNTLFLSGIGGIGKTEIAKRYAYIHQQFYDTIVFLSFSGSLEETFCSSELNINTLEQGDGESNADYFKRKLDALKQVVTERDLIIIDNFDVDYDDHLEDILACRCKFLITTREDFRDYNYAQTEIDEMDEFDEIYEVFQSYHPEEYEAEKKESVKNIIELVERHTMTVELFAKYLRDTGEDPEELLQKLMEKEGVTNVSDIGIKHRKDQKLRAKNINGHLLVLFDLSKFTKLEEELIKSLALLGYIKITKTRFFEFFLADGKEAVLQNLIRRGWIEYDDITTKISLHQIILDLVLNHLKPASGDCPGIVKGMLSYMNTEPANNVEWEIRKKLMSAFMERIIGDDIPYAKLCVAYKKSDYLSIAEKICKSCSETEAKDVLQQICRLQLKEIGKKNDVFAVFEEDNIEEYCREKSAQLVGIIRQAMQYAEEFSTESSYLGKFYVELGKDIESISDSSDYEVFFGIGEDNPVLDCLYDLVAELYDIAEEKIVESDLSAKEKERLIKQIQKFYLDDDFCAMYRCEKYADADKAFHYQEILENLRPYTQGENSNGSVSIDGETSYFYTDDITYSDMAQQEAEEGNYAKAIEYYRIAMEKGQEFYSTAFSQMADYYEKLGEREKARECLITVLDYDKERIANNEDFSSYSNHVCYELILLYRSENHYEAAKQYAKEWIQYNSEEIKDAPSAYDLKWLLVANHLLYAMSSDFEHKEAYWNECIRYYQMLAEDEKLEEEMLPFLLEYLSKMEDDSQKISKAYEFLERFETSFIDDVKADLLNYILRLCEKDETRTKDLITVFARYAAHFMDCWPRDYEKALEYINHAQKLMKQYEIQDAYLENLLYKELGECYSNVDRYEYEQTLEVKSRCNYHLLAVTDGHGKDTETQAKLLQEAADAYGYIDNYKQQKTCFIEGISLLSCLDCTYDSDVLSLKLNLYENLLSCCVRLCDTETLKEYANQMLPIVVENCFESIATNERHNVDHYCWRMKNIAYELGQGNCIEESVLCYLTAVTLGISQTINKEILRKTDIYEGMTKEFEEEFHKAMHGEMSDRGIDLVVDVYKEIKELLREEKYGSIEQDFLWFLEQYQKQEVEFKRE